METGPNSHEAQPYTVYRYFLTEFPQLIDFVRDLLGKGFNPEQIQQFAEGKIGVCETSYSVKLIAQHLMAAECIEKRHSC